MKRELLIGEVLRANYRLDFGALHGGAQLSQGTSRLFDNCAATKDSLGSMNIKVARAQAYPLGTQLPH